MSARDKWFAERDSRTVIYPGGRVLDDAQCLAISAQAEYIFTYSGQVTLVVLANLLARMGRVVRLDLPNAPPLLPGMTDAKTLTEAVLQTMSKASPHGRFHCGAPADEEHVFYVGSRGEGRVVHGSQWMAYAGLGTSPLPMPANDNPIGPAFAAILAVAQFCGSDFHPASSATLVDTLRWSPGKVNLNEPTLPTDMDLGDIWTVGVGSVGSAIMYFLPLVTRNFRVRLFDMDVVKTHNLDRSPIFIDSDVGRKKVEAVSEFLHQCGVRRAEYEGCALHESEAYRNRQEGHPDLFISAANELNVRDTIEAAYPPLQIYGTTGRNWQASLLRHSPVSDACSCCIFPSKTHIPTACAQGKVTRPKDGVQVDAALPFLSFAAGLMAAAEIVKLQLAGYPFTENNVVYYSKIGAFAHSTQCRRDGCSGCATRSRNVHRRMIGDSRYAKFLS